MNQVEYLSRSTSQQPPRTDSFWSRVVHQTLCRVTSGHIRLVDGQHLHHYGARVADLDIHCDVVVHHPRFYRRLVLGGSIGAGEAYMDGDWSCTNLVGLVRILARNEAALARMDGPSAWLRDGVNRIIHRLRANTRRGSARNIAEHYDLSNEFFATFLDEHRMYSSAVFDHPNLSLDDASTAKLARLCAKLELQPGDRLLEIGTGWGGLAAYAASHYDVRVTTTTISHAQHQHAKALIADRGLEDRVEVLLCDYRDLTGTYDKIVSVEMVEAVGHQFLDGYFAKCEALLKPGGLFVMQAITIEDYRYTRALRNVDFIKKYIFPGSFIPSTSRLITASARSGFMLTNLEDFARDYARTLRVWRENTTANEERIAKLGFDRRFRRMWEFYLSYCEGGFAERSISNVQLIFSKSGYRGQPWRASRSHQKSTNRGTLS